MARHVDDEVQVAVWRTTVTLTALALEPDALAVLDSGRDAHLKRPAGRGASGAVAGDAWVFDDHAAATALVAGLGHGEHAAGRAGDHARPVTVLAHLRD